MARFGTTAPFRLGRFICCGGRGKRPEPAPEPGRVTLCVGFVTLIGGLVRLCVGLLRVSGGFVTVAVENEFPGQLFSACEALGPSLERLPKYRELLDGVSVALVHTISESAIVARHRPIFVDSPHRPNYNPFMQCSLGVHSRRKARC